MGNSFTCHQCGEHKTHESKFTTGYRIDRDNNKICYECCGINDKKELEAMMPGEKTYLYLSEKETGWVITNWPGTLNIRCSRPKIGKHNMAGRRFDVWFSFAGNEYHGVQYGTNTQVLHVKRLK